MMDSAKSYYNILDVPKYKEKLESEWNYYRLVYQQGQTDSNSILVETALHKMKKLFSEVEQARYSFADLNLPECFFYRSLLGF